MCMDRKFRWSPGHRFVPTGVEGEMRCEHCRRVVTPGEAAAYVAGWNDMAAAVRPPEPPAEFKVDPDSPEARALVGLVREMQEAPEGELARA